MVAWQLQDFSKDARSSMQGYWNQFIFSWSNWYRAKFFHVDFPSAVIKTGLPDGERSTEIGKPNLVMHCHLPIASVSEIVGR
jgi:hypothetical protein